MLLSPPAEGNYLRNEEKRYPARVLSQTTNIIKLHAAKHTIFRTTNILLRDVCLNYGTILRVLFHFLDTTDRNMLPLLQMYMTLTLILTATCSSETTTHVYQSTRCHIPDDSHYD
jgi:hypothetical protein